MAKRKEFKIGDLVEITQNESFAYRIGERAIICKRPKTSLFKDTIWADFSNQGNTIGNGIWCIGDPKHIDFRLVGGDK